MSTRRQLPPQRGHAWSDLLDRVAGWYAGSRRRRAVAHWQRIRDRLWRHTEWQVPLRPGESAASWRNRRLRHMAVYYETRAGDARARGRWVPTLGQLTMPAATHPVAYHRPAPANGLRFAPFTTAPRL